MSTFKNYTIIRSLGKGGMAEVFLAEDIRFKTKVAIKVLNHEFSSNSNISQRFIAEARNLFRMSHPNIVRVTDLIEEDGKKAFVMEYIEGNNLRDEAEKLKTLNSEVIGACLSQMLAALGYCHSEGLVHRDVKPSNFMLTSKGQIKLLDFGIAKDIENRLEYTQTGTSQMMGTPLYMSPEQILETKSVDFRSDIYSLGVVLWQLVTSKKPYDSQTLSAFQIQLKIVKDPLPITGSKFDEIIQKCTAKDSKDRFQNCDMVQQSLNKLVNGPSLGAKAHKTFISSISFDDKTTIVSTPKPSPLQRPEIKTAPKSKNPNRKLLFGILILVLTIFSVVSYVVNLEDIGHSDWYPPGVKSEISRRGKWSDIDKEAFRVDLQKDVKYRNITLLKNDFEDCCLTFAENEFDSYNALTNSNAGPAFYNTMQLHCGAKFSNLATTDKWQGINSKNEMCFLEKGNDGIWREGPGQEPRFQWREVRSSSDSLFFSSVDRPGYLMVLTKEKWLFKYSNRDAKYLTLAFGTWK